MTKRLRNLTVEIVPVSKLNPYAGNARRHSREQIAQIAASMTTFGWTIPILVDTNYNVIAGHGRLAAAKLLGLKLVPVSRIGPMFAAEIRRRRAKRMHAWPQWQWHLDEVFVKSNGETYYLWRAMDHEGEVLEAFVSKRRDREAALSEQV